MTTNQLGNLIYGVVAHALGLEEEARQYGRGEYLPGHLLGKHGPDVNWKMRPEKETAFDIGIDIAEVLDKWHEVPRFPDRPGQRFSDHFRRLFSVLTQNNVNGGYPINKTSPNCTPSDTVFSGPNTDPSTHQSPGIADDGNIRDREARQC